MKPFEATAFGAQAELAKHEIALLTSLTEQYVELLGGASEPVTGGDDPLAWLSEAMGESSRLDHTDPLIQRLFPDARPDDPVASAEFRRFTEDDQRRTRIEDAAVVLAALGRDADALAVTRADFPAWLRTINALRLSLAVRLGIEDEQAHEELLALPSRDPRSYLVSLFEWLGFFLESLLEAMGA